MRAVTGWFSRPDCPQTSIAFLSSLRDSSKFRFWYSSTAFLLSLVTFSTAAESSASARAVAEVASATREGAGRRTDGSISERGGGGVVAEEFRKRWAVLAKVASMYHGPAGISRLAGARGTIRKASRIMSI